MSPEHRAILQKYRDKLRKEYPYRRCSPCRLGHQIAYHREIVQCPYLPGSRGEKMYLKGMQWGEADRAMDDAFNEKYPNNDYL